MIDAAIILAGGKGQRLAPWPTPKVLLPIGGQPILLRILGYLQEQGVPRAVVCVGHRASDIAGALVTGMPLRLAVTLSNAGEDVTMGARLLRAQADGGLFDRRVVVLYGDELADVNMAKLEATHEAGDADRDAPARVLTFTACDYRLPFGVVRDGRIHAMDTVSVNIGFVLVDSPAWDLLHPEDGLADWINRVAGHGAAGVYEHRGRRATVNSLDEWAKAEEVWR